MFLRCPSHSPRVSWLCFWVSWSRFCDALAVLFGMSCPGSWSALPMLLGCPGCPPSRSCPCSWGVLSTRLGCPGCVPGVPQRHVPLTALTVALPRSRRTGWSSTPCGMSEATAVPSAAAPTAIAGGSASPSWATIPTPTATRAGGSSAASSCPATGGSHGCWAGCSTQLLGAAPCPCRHPSGCALM